MLQVHISTIKSGDTILHNGEVMTVSPSNFNYCSFMGISLFGDSYNLGHKLVTKIIDMSMVGSCNTISNSQTAKP